MKKITLAIAIISLMASCKKCYKCTTIITSTSTSGYHPKLINEYDYCTTKKDDVYNEERRGTAYAPGGTEEKTTCSRKANK